MHNVQYFSFPTTKKKTDIEDELSLYVKRETWQEGGSGLYSPIRWYEDVCVDSESAQTFIEKHDKGWYDQLAVKFIRFDKPVTSKKLTDLEDQASETKKKLRDLESKVAFTEFKAQYISCKNCGSKLNKDYIKRNNCVVCGYDMRSDTTKNAIAKLKEKVNAIENAIREERRKLAAKKAKEAKEYWLVKIEYHT